MLIQGHLRVPFSKQLIIKEKIMSDEQDNAAIATDMLILAAYIQRLNYTDGNFTKTVAKIEEMAIALARSHALVMAAADESGVPLPGIDDITLGHCPEIKQQLCRLISEIDKKISGGKKDV